MLDVSHVLDRNNIRTSNVIFAIADIAEKVRYADDPLYTATKLYNDILSVPVVFKDAILARIACKHMIRDVLTYKCIIDNDDVSEIVDQSLEYANEFRKESCNAYLWATPEELQPITTSKVIEGIDMKLKVNENGKIRKGGKGPATLELYQKFVIDAEVPLNRQQFIALLMEQLEMTEMGASTYHYNCKKSAAQSLS